MDLKENHELENSVSYKSKQYWENKRKIQSAVVAKRVENAKALAE